MAADDTPMPGYIVLSINKVFRHFISAAISHRDDSNLMRRRSSAYGLDLMAKVLKSIVIRC
jgi:hypothetical protein